MSHNSNSSHAAIPYKFLLHEPRFARCATVVYAYPYNSCIYPSSGVMSIAELASLVGCTEYMAKKAREGLESACVISQITFIDADGKLAFTYALCSMDEWGAK